VRKIVSLIFVFIVFILFCLIPIQTPLHLVDHMNQTSVLEDQHNTAEITHLDEKTQPSFFPAIPSFIFVFLLSIPLQFKFIQHIRSFIPILKLAYLLIPVKYNSRYIV
jgi:hypothetical protein